MGERESRMSIEALIDGVIGREGGYTNNPNDPGGATCWGITERVARANGYAGPMSTMPRDTAKDIYFSQYVSRPGFAAILPLSEAIAEEVVDTGVNMGPAVASIFLQKALNTFNNQGHDYPDLKVDGDVGPGTIGALKALLAKRGHDGETVLLRALNALQGEHYISIGANRPASEAFEFGWFMRRMS
jgi:lysozyme family protein